MSGRGPADRRSGPPADRSGLGDAAGPRAGRGHRGQKGGDPAPAYLAAEPTDHDVEGGRLVAVSRGDLGRWPPLDEEGAEGFIAAVRRGPGLEEVAPAGLVVHGVGSHPLTVFRPPGAP